MQFAKTDFCDYLTNQWSKFNKNVALIEIYQIKKDHSNWITS